MMMMMMIIIIIKRLLFWANLSALITYDDVNAMTLLLKQVRWTGGDAMSASYACGQSRLEPGAGGSSQGKPT